MRLRYSPLPEMVSIFPSPLLDSALINVPSTCPGFLGNLRLVAGPLGRRRLDLRRPASLVLLVLLRSNPWLLSLLASLARRGRTARVRLPFPLPLEAPAALEGKVKEPERSLPDGTSLPLRVGVLPGSALEAVAGNRTRVLGSDRSLGRLPCSLQGLSSSPFSHPGIASDVPGSSPRAQALRQEVEAMLAKGALEIALDPGRGFYSRVFLMEKASGVL